MNAKMPALKRAFEAAGYASVKTALSSGNVVFSAKTASESVLQTKAEKAMRDLLGRTFITFIRSSQHLTDLVEEDPFAAFPVAVGTKKVVTFLRDELRTMPKLPPPRDGARILAVRGREALSVYTPGPHGPVFMSVIERTFGKDVTTRTWETVCRVARLTNG